MEDNKEKILEFIEDYRECRLLWDPYVSDYNNKNKRLDALATLGEKHNVDVKIVKNKIKNLRSYFSKEYQKVMSKKKDEGRYRSTWFAYKAMSFVLQSFPRENKENGDTIEDTQNFDATDGADELTTKEKEEMKRIESIIDKTAQSYMQMKSGQAESSADVTAVKKPEEKEARKRTDDSKKDECAVFGQLIAHKLRRLSPRNKVLAQSRISSVFFDLELEEIDCERAPKTADVPPPTADLIQPKPLDDDLEEARILEEAICMPEMYPEVPNMPDPLYTPGDDAFAMYPKVAEYPVEFTTDDPQFAGRLPSVNGEINVLLLPKEEMEQEFTVEMVEQGPAGPVWRCLPKLTQTPAQFIPNTT